jgi:hypothetical protein
MAARATPSADDTGVRGDVAVAGATCPGAIAAGWLGVVGTAWESGAKGAGGVLSAGCIVGGWMGTTSAGGAKSAGDAICDRARQAK